MSGPLHLLRPFARWQWRKRRLTTVEQAEEYVEYIASLGFGEFDTSTARRPMRMVADGGGSVYFVKAGITLFRMPFLQVEGDSEQAPTYLGRHLVIMEPRLIRVEPMRVGFVRGWRYLADDAKPADLEAPGEVGLPPHLVEELRELGL